MYLLVYQVRVPSEDKSEKGGRKQKKALGREKYKQQKKTGVCILVIFLSVLPRFQIGVCFCQELQVAKWLACVAVGVAEISFI